MNTLTTTKSLLIAVLLGIIAGAVAGGTNSSPSKPEVRTYSLGQIPATAEEGRPLVSPDARHVAYRVRHGGKWKMSLDGVEGESYEKVSKPLFSPDGKRLAYVAAKGFERQTVVVDGKEGREYEVVPPESLLFSPDSRHVAFTSVPPKSTNVWVVVDGKECAEFQGICAGIGDQALLFSPDSKRLVYGAARLTNDGGFAYFVVVEGDEQKTYPTRGEPAVAGFSPQTQRVAWVEGGGTKHQFVVVNGKAGKEYEAIGPCIRFSPDGNRTAYFAEQAGKRKVVLDDREGPAFDDVAGDMVFNADSRDLAYTAKRGNRYLVVRHDHEGRDYDKVGTLVFSPDGQHLAYFAQRGSRHFVVVDGQESGPYEGLGMAPLFSPDSAHLAYAAQQGDSWHFILDGKPGKGYYKPLRWLCFSPDSKHLAYGAARGPDGAKIVIVRDEVELWGCEGASMGTLIFDGPGLLRCVVHHMDERFNWELQRVEISLEQK